jgi:hypothetical protein
LRVSRKRSLRVFCLAAMADLLCGCLKLNQPGGTAVPVFEAV